MTRHTTTGRTHQLRARVVCPRHRWPEVHTILRRERQPAELSSTPTGDVLIRTTAHAADMLRRICVPAPRATPDWTPVPEPKPHEPQDAWERAFSRYRAERTARGAPPEPAEPTDPAALQDDAA